jgi:hypothetical protein
VGAGRRLRHGRTQRPGVDVLSQQQDRGQRGRIAEHAE